MGLTELERVKRPRAIFYVAIGSFTQLVDSFVLFYELLRVNKNLIDLNRFQKKFCDNNKGVSSNWRD